MNVFRAFAWHQCFLFLNIQRGCRQLIELEKLTVYAHGSAAGKKPTVWCVLYAFRIPGVRRMPGMLFTGIKPVVRCMM